MCSLLQYGTGICHYAYDVFNQLKRFLSISILYFLRSGIDKLNIMVDDTSLWNMVSRFGSPFSSERLWFVDTVLWLCPSLPTETLKWLSSLPILMQKSFWWWQCSDRYILSLFPHLHTPFPPFSPSLISLMVSVDVKHQVYWLTDAVLCMWYQHAGRL